MIYFCCYDIHSNKIRRKVIRVLEEYGERIQKSIFILHVSVQSVQEIVEKIDSFFPENDDLLILGVEKDNPIIIRGRGNIQEPDSVCVL